MGGACYTCDYVMRERNEITGEYLYFCKKLRKSVLWDWRCKLYKHEILSPEEQEKQEKEYALRLNTFSTKKTIIRRKSK